MPELTFPAALHEQLSEADRQFREGHFELADELYTKLLAELEVSSEADDASISSTVLKIAESRYAAGAYEKAKESYEQLLALQDKRHDTTSKDRIFTFVKAARNYEKCEDQANAQTKYDQAYELAKTVLPVKHFLRRTVFECYAQWLRTQKSNPLVLSILESELGTAPTPAAKESDAPVEPENKSGAKREQRKSEDDFASLKSKLGQKKKDRDEDKQTAEAETASQTDAGSQTEACTDSVEKNSSLLSNSKVDKSVDRQVAARKFLNISIGAKHAKTDKSRLKNALGNESTAPSTSDKLPQQAVAETSTGTPADADEFVVDEQAELLTQDLLAEAEEILKSLELAQQDKSASSPLMSPGATADTGLHDLKGAPASAQLDSSTLSDFELYQLSGSSSVIDPEIEMERLLAESARLLFNIESLNGPVEQAEARAASEGGNSGLALKGTSSVAMRLSDRSYFGQEEEKEKQPDELSLADIIEKFLPSTGVLRKVLQIAIPVVVIVSVTWFAVIASSNSKAEKLSTAPIFMAPLLTRTFSTADGSAMLAFKPDGIEIRASNYKAQPKFFFWRGTTNDELRLLQGVLKNCIWMKPSGEGITTAEGKIFYSPDAPETKVRAVMNTLKTNAMAYYSSAGSYPPPEAVQPDRYTNPVTQRIEPVNVCNMVVSKDRPKEADTRLDLDLENGQLFNNEPAAKPGSVSVFCEQLGDPNHQPGAPEVVTTQSMYIHGFDRNGALLRTGATKQVLLIELKPGGPKTPAVADDSAQYLNRDICFYQGEPPSPIGIGFKYLAVAILIAGLVGLFIYLQKRGP
ncbi:MAG TPA: tetratricopeptide repeat protein [Drouetiella sp.]|jgi:tetratricopeptide (TPR) repeat protein